MFRIMIQWRGDNASIKPEGEAGTRGWNPSVFRGWGVTGGAHLYFRRSLDVEEGKFVGACGKMKEFSEIPGKLIRPIT